MNTTTTKPETKEERAARIIRQVEERRRAREARQAGMTEEEIIAEAFEGLG